MKVMCRIVESILQTSSNGTSRSNQFATSAEVLTVIEKAVTIFSQEGAVLKVSRSFVVVGDLHGNIYTLVRIFEEFGYPDSRCFIFLGDYVDRGTNSCEVIVLLYVLKILFPNQLFLLRGNHEFGFMTDSYGFRQECLLRFLPRVYSSLIDSFSKLPVAAIINDRIFCVHGGITPDLVVGSLNKDSDELLWSDPRNEIEGFSSSDRGRGFYFGQDVLQQFLKAENFNMIIRSHEHCREGFCWPFGCDCGCLTIFSSVDYCGEMNDDSVCVIDKDNKYEICQLSYESLTKHRRILIQSFVLESLRIHHLGWNESNDQTNLHFDVNILI
jgi:diadenosine tetraphosphatase ApaH/serine/threonine PP2A family protein phosphatase